MPNPNTNFKDSFGTDLGNRLITKEYLMTVYPQIANQLITPELWVWGQNSYYGNLGNNTITDRLTPVTTFAGGSNWKQVAGKGIFTAAIKTDGTLWTWGYNSNGQLGDNTTTYRSTPVTTFAGGSNWKQVSGGGIHAAAIKTDGTLWTWGANFDGQLGDNRTTQRITPVTTFAGGTNWKQVSGGGDHTVAIKTDGTLWSWGRNSYGQLGNNTTTNRTTPVTTFAGGTNWKQVDGGGDHTVAIKTDGTLWSWGRNSYGQLGDNTTTQRITPVTTFAGGTNWKQVDGGNNHTTAIKTDGTLWTWGYNTYGQIGINNTTNRSTPVTTFAGGTNWKQVSCGGDSTSAIKTDGTLWTWGRNSYGKLGINLFGGYVFPSINGTMSTNASVFYATDLQGLTLSTMNNYSYSGNDKGDFNMDNLFYTYFPSDVINIDTVNKTITFGSATYNGPGFTGNLSFFASLNNDKYTPVTTFAGGSNWKQVSGGFWRTAAIRTSDDLQGI